MVYTSDLRVKNLLRDIHLKILKKLENIDNTSKEKIFLRIFDQTHEDNRLWENGGLTFRDPDTNLKLGSNDAAWFVEKNNPIPLVVVEGTYGTERGQFGDGQYNRFSHSLAVAKLGHIGVYMIPFKGESYTRNASIKECKTDNIRMQYAYIRKPMLKAALEVSNKESGEYVFIDTYEPELLVDIVVNKYLSYSRMENKLVESLEKAKKRMREIVGDYNYIESTNQIVPKIFSLQKVVIPNSIGRIYTQNYAALTTSTKRDAHGLLGKNIAQKYLIQNQKIFSIYIRLDKTDLKKLYRRGGKEIKYIFPTTEELVCLDDLVFKDEELRKKVLGIKDQNLHKIPAKSLIKKVVNELENGNILVNTTKLGAKSKNLSLSDFV